MNSVSTAKTGQDSVTRARTKSTRQQVKFSVILYLGKERSRLPEKAFILLGLFRVRMPMPLSSFWRSTDPPGNCWSVFFTSSSWKPWKVLYRDKPTWWSTFVLEDGDVFKRLFAISGKEKHTVVQGSRPVLLGTENHGLYPQSQLLQMLRKESHVSPRVWEERGQKRKWKWNKTILSEYNQWGVACLAHSLKPNNSQSISFQDITEREWKNDGAHTGNEQPGRLLEHVLLPQPSQHCTK